MNPLILIATLIMRIAPVRLLTVASLMYMAGAERPKWFDHASSSPCPSIAPGPASLQQLSELPLAQPLAPDIESAIRRTLSLYPFAVDGRNFAAFDHIFSTDVRANYSEPINELLGLEQVKTAVAAGLDNFASTHHSYGTQYIAACGKTSAISVTYYTASHYFKPSQPAEVQNSSDVLYATGRYEDTWQKQRDGSWKIANRNLVYTGPLIANL